MRPERRSPRRVALATVLVVDDALMTRRILRRALEERGFAVVEANDGDHALEACRHESPDIIVLDIDFGGGPEQGASTLRALQESPRTARTPVVVINGDSTEPEEIVARLQEELAERARRRDLDEREAQDDSGATDALTSLGTRQSLTAELARLQRDIGDATVAVFIVDLDHFRAVNTTNGHLVGDAILRIAARRLSTIIGGRGFLVRWGGEEFLAVVPEVDDVDPGAIAERMRAAICEAPFTIGPEVTVSLTASVGVSSAPLADFDRGVERADAALNAAKKTGRSSIAFT